MKFNSQRPNIAPFRLCCIIIIIIIIFILIFVLCVQYQMNKFTIMPLGSGSQGVAIRTKVAAARNVTSVESDVHRVTNLLELGPELYGVLREGDNHFYCKGSLSNGRSVREFFVVRKVPVRAAHLHPLWTA